MRVPTVGDGSSSAWAQYTVRVRERDRVAGTLREKGIPTAVYDPLRLHRQQAYRKFPTAPAGVPVAEQLADEVLSLPMHPFLERAMQGPHHRRACSTPSRPRPARVGQAARSRSRSQSSRLTSCQKNIMWFSRAAPDSTICSCSSSSRSTTCGS